MPDDVLNDDESPRGMQPETKVLLTIMGCAVVVSALVLGIAALGREERELAYPMQPTRQGHMLMNVSATKFAPFCFGILLVYGLALLFLLAWVARDARARGESGILWVLVILFFHWLGLLIYLAARPRGQLVACRRCSNWKLDHALRCPHCRIGPYYPCK
jgi:hypothetical protein